MNRVCMIGRLTRDPELRTTTTGKQVADFTLAVDRRGEGADFFRVNAWDKTAQFATAYLTKGRLVSVEGRLQSRKFTDKDGNNREVVEIVADNVQGLDKPKDEAPAVTHDDPTYDPFAEE